MKLNGFICLSICIFYECTQGCPLTGHKIQKLSKAEAQMNHIHKLLSKKNLQKLSFDEEKALSSLLTKDTYQSSFFPQLHAEFKTCHNEVFVKLSKYSSNKPPKVFYLDGASGETTSSLLGAGFSIDDLFTANIFPGTVAALQDRFLVINLTRNMRQCSKSQFSCFLIYSLSFLASKRVCWES